MTDRKTARLVDFHCHLDLYPDHAAAVAQRERERVFTLTVTTTPKAFPRNKELADRTKYVRAALGLHPQLVAERAQELSIWKEYLPSTRYVGEVGLDAGRQFYASFEQQKFVFAEILSACAATGDKVLSVHSVRCAKVVLDTIDARLPVGRGRVVLHWFTGSASEARRAADMGCYFSINAAMLRNERSAALVRTLPKERILTETDGPFTDNAPGGVGPADVKPARDGLAKLFQMGQNEIDVLISENLRELVS
ncbi:Qat anti-phage system TatD family nuclease QatD [Hoeflea sp.]|uniref:Qat anti-phage system TatD family nuclease QatD n=1 Tax=Hoeflea sp. TaxID=1940281 RepID=UPI003B010DBF